MTKLGEDTFRLFTHYQLTVSGLRQALAVKYLFSGQPIDKIVAPNTTLCIFGHGCVPAIFEL